MTPPWQQLRLTVPRVGFVGSGSPMSPAQYREVRDLLLGYAATQVHHGDTPGADVQVHRLADYLGLWRFVHPASDHGERAGLLLDAVYPVTTYANCLCSIVDATETLIVVLDGHEPGPSAGPWAAAGRAATSDKVVTIVDQDGTVRSTGSSSGKTRAAPRRDTSTPASTTSAPGAV